MKKNPIVHHYALLIIVTLYFTTQGLHQFEWNASV